MFVGLWLLFVVVDCCTLFVVSCCSFVVVSSSLLLSLVCYVLFGRCLFVVCCLLFVDC